METFPYLSESHIFHFLIQIFILLSTAKILSGILSRWGWPALAGEILVGIVLGPTLLGRFFPGFFHELFPQDIAQQNMLETISWFGVLFLLLVTGFEVSISNVWKQGKASVTIGVTGVLIPILIGCAVFVWFPQSLWGESADRLIFTLFLATAAAISAIPVIAKILHDLEILKSDLGLTTISAFVINDILGWLIFSFVLGLAAAGASTGGKGAFRVFFEILMFGTVCLTVGSRVVGGITARLQKTRLPQTATILTFITCLAMLCGAITQWIGIHAILGFFLAGIMAGNAPEISERTREIISQMVHAIFVPLFFVSIGLKVDFIGNFNLPVVFLFTLVAIAGKFAGAWAGCRLARMNREDSISIGIAHIPGGAMEIIIGVLALELKLISEIVFVAVVFAALSSSVMVGPLLAWSIRRHRTLDIGRFVMKTAVTPSLSGSTRWDVIAELCENLAEGLENLDGKFLNKKVAEREKRMGTSLEKGVAVPHAAISGLKEPVIAFGLSREGVEWDARDGLPARFVFLILTPEEGGGIQVQILAAIARFMVRPGAGTDLLGKKDAGDICSVLKNGLKLQK